MNDHGFFATKSSKINFITAQYCAKRSKQQISDALDEVINKYSARSFNLTAIHGDNEFNVKELKPHFVPARIHIYGEEEHVGPIERAIRAIKERTRCNCHAMPYHYYPKIMIIGMIENVMKWLNAFLSKGGISNTMSPAMLLEGKPNPDMNKNYIIFGLHAMVFVRSNNTMSRRSVLAIALNESNEHGGFYFMNQ